MSCSKFPEIDKNLCCHCLQKLRSKSFSPQNVNRCFPFSSLLPNNTVFSGIAKVYRIPEERLIPITGDTDPRKLCFSCAFFLGTWVKSFDDFHSRLEESSHVYETYVKFNYQNQSAVDFEDNNVTQVKIEVDPNDFAELDSEDTSGEFEHDSPSEKLDNVSGMIT